MSDALGEKPKDGLRISPDFTEFILRNYSELAIDTKDSLIPEGINKIQTTIVDKLASDGHPFRAKQQISQISRVKADYVSATINTDRLTFTEPTDAPKTYEKPLYIKVATVVLPEEISAPVKIEFKNKHSAENSYSLTITGYNAGNDQTITIDQGLSFETTTSFELILAIPALWKTSSYEAPSETFYFGTFRRVIDGPRSFIVRELTESPPLPTTYYEFDLQNSTDGLKFTKSIELKSSFEFKYSAELDLNGVKKAFSTEARIKFENTVTFSIEARLDGKKKYNHYTNEISRIIYLKN